MFAFTISNQRLAPRLQTVILAHKISKQSSATLFNPSVLATRRMMGDSSTAPPPTAAVQGRRIQVREARPAEVGVIVDIHYDAFKSAPMSRLLSPGGVTEDAKAKLAERFFPQEEEQGSGGDPGEHLVHVAELVGEDGGESEIVAFAKWSLFRRERSQEEWDVERPPATLEMLGEGTNPEAFNAFIGGMSKIKKDYIKGQKHLHLGILACSSKYHRLGAGSALLQHGIQIADAEGLPTFLESSPEGYRLYKRNGFQDVWAFDLDITQRWGLIPQPGSNWGHDNGIENCGPCAEGGYRTVGMKRPAKGTQ